MGKKSTVTMVAAALGMLLVILESKTAAAGIREGIGICIQTLIPALFPFMILSNLLTGSLAGQPIPLLGWICKACRIPKGAESLFVVGLLGGYPVGAQNVDICCRNRILSRTDAARMSVFCNNAGPAFLFGMLGSIFDSITDIWCLWIIQIIGAVITGMLIPGGTTSKIRLVPNQTASLPDAMNSSLRAMAYICGWVVFFRMILTFLERWLFWLLPVSAQVLLSGILELSNGCLGLNRISSNSLQFLLASVILPFGGLCVLLQTVSVSSCLRVHAYLLGKLLQSGVCLILSAGYLLLRHTNDTLAIGIALMFCLSVSLFFYGAARKKVIAF